MAVICTFSPIKLIILIEKCEKPLFLAQETPFCPRVGPPGVSAKFENWSKVSGEDGVVPQR